MKPVIYGWILLLSIISIYTGCRTAMAEEKPRYVLALVDETGSFELGGQPFWPEILPLVEHLVLGLQPGEGFGLIGIDDHGFDADDVRVSMQVLDQGLLRARLQKNQLLDQVRGLARRTKKMRTTDITGALYQAADLLKGEEEFHGVVVIFSDMIQTPKFPDAKEVADLRFPTATEVYCFYVNATKERTGVAGQEWWKKIVSSWSSIFAGAGLESVQNDQARFYQRGQTSREMVRLFPKTM